MFWCSEVDSQTLYRFPGTEDRMMYTYLKKNERKRRILLQSLVLFAGIAVAVILFLSIGNHLHSHQVQASDPYTEVTYYQSVYVQSGDSLWTIADRYMSDGEDKNDYIDEIRQINHITGSHLTAGSYIIVPYTVSEQR
ncbi:MAG: LysM peptidoglycan-binding domain-containing protein [Lachnospiraceae bacterium]|nr:LysM peptidoglycan-binding domain-containing protein [Lachnospiraceae bacterium]